jgi:hypothetical protein
MNKMKSQNEKTYIDIPTKFPSRKRLAMQWRRFEVKLLFLCDGFFSLCCGLLAIKLNELI